MLQTEDAYAPYSYVPYYPSSASVGVLENRPATQAPPEIASQPPRYPSGPLTTPAAPRKRPGRGGAILLLTLVLALIFGVGLFAGWEFAGNNGSASTSSKTTTTTATSSATSTIIETQQEAAIAKIEPAVVELEVTTAQRQQIGSGVIIDKNGDIVTNNHVVSGAVTINAVLNDGSTVHAQLVGSDAADDLAVVRIQPFAHMTVAQLGDSSKLSVGQEVLAIGNPLGITETATQGIVSALNRSVTESNGVTIAHAIQTDASINPGNSGGALVDLQGNLIGIPTLAAVNTESNTPANGVGFAIPANTIATVLHQLGV